MRAWKITRLALVAIASAMIAWGLVAQPGFAADPLQPPVDEPDPVDTTGALAGGLLAIGLAAFGLVITFRSLSQELKGRRNRYRRRVRRPPRSPADT